MSNTLAYVAVLLSVTAGFAYFNHHLLRLPRNSGLLVIALIASLILRGVEALFPSVELATLLRHALGRINFGAALLNGFLAFLLFAAALDVEPKALIDRKWTISALATIGVLISTFAIGAGLFFIFRFVGIEVPLLYCLVFGALISPTDPVTVTGALERLPIPRGLQAVIAGESLFNDGIGIVLYSIFLQLAAQPSEASSILVGSIAFVRETGGGILLGVAGGGFALLAMRGIDEYNIELMISLALVTGIYAVAETIGVSGPVAVVTAGLLMGSIGVKYAVSGTTHDYLQKFWSLTDEVLNSLLFLLIGLEFAALDLHWAYIAAAGLAIPLSVGVRGLSITLASLPLNLGAAHKVRSISLLTWSGLRGGISVALALSLPDGPYREALLTACYGIAVFTMIVQGLTLHPLAARLYPGIGREGTADS